jgi:hypothetical protein
MEPLKVFYELLRDGGPVAMAAIFAFMWWLERKDNKDNQKRQTELEDKLLGLAVAQTGATAKLEPTLVNLKELLLQILNRQL